MRILIAGAAGFAGRHLTESLYQRGHEVFPADIRPDENAPCKLDICDRKNVDAVLKASRPEAVVLLSGMSSVGASWKDPAATFQINTAGALNLFSAVQESFPEAKFIFAGSAEEYGRPSAVPLSEGDLCTPSNPYALSKNSAGNAMAMMAEKQRTAFIHLRLANHFGPGQSTGFVIPDFASQIALKMLKHDNSDIVAGNLEAKRDFLYIDDVIDAYIRIIEAQELKHTVYNIGSGRTISIREMLDTLINLAGISSKIVIDPGKFRPADTTGTALDISRMKDDFNWRPRTDLKTALQLTLDSWLKKLS